jgi:hypothetical protein
MTAAWIRGDVDVLAERLAQSRSVPHFSQATRLLS